MLALGFVLGSGCSESEELSGGISTGAEGWSFVGSHMLARVGAPETGRPLEVFLELDRIAGSPEHDALAVQMNISRDGLGPFRMVDSSGAIEDGLGSVAVQVDGEELLPAPSGFDPYGDLVHGQVSISRVEDSFTLGDLRLEFERGIVTVSFASCVQ
jgi:hypothetical protein